MPKSKKTRAPKQSSGAGIRHRRSPQTDTQLILLGKGPMRNVVKRWREPVK